LPVISALPPPACLTVVSTPVELSAPTVVDCKLFAIVFEPRMTGRRCVPGTAPVKNRLALCPRPVAFTKTTADGIGIACRTDGGIIVTRWRMIWLDDC